MRRRFGLEFDPVTEILPLIGSKDGWRTCRSRCWIPAMSRSSRNPATRPTSAGRVLAGGEPHIYALTARTGFLVELDELPADVLRRTRLLFLNYPNNPTAAIAPRDYLERTVATCRRHGIVLAYDNPYCDLTFDGYRAPSIFEIAGAREVAVEFFSMSKTFSMTGWRLGWAAGAPSFIQALTRVKSYVDTGPFLAVQQAAVQALDHAEAADSADRRGTHPPARRGRDGPQEGRVYPRKPARGDVPLGSAARWHRVGRVRPPRP